MREALRRLHQDERGHTPRLITTVLGAPGSVALTAGIVGGWDVVTIIGGAALAVALVFAGAVGHTQVEYPILERLDDLEKR